MGAVEPLCKDAPNTGVPSFHAALTEEAGKTGPPACQHFPKWLHVIQIQIFSSKTLTPLPLRERPLPIWHSHNSWIQPQVQPSRGPRAGATR